MNFLNFGILTFAYLLGSINSAIIVCRIFKLPSPRSAGSGNPGATNVLRIGGKAPAALTLIFDILKGLIPVLLAKAIADDEFIASCTALYVVFGHVFPVFFEFKGGKGVAPLIGTLFGFELILGLIFVVVWLCVIAVSRYSSLSALIATAAAGFYVIFRLDLQTAIPFLAIAIIVFIKHRENIKRLINRQESKIGQVKKIKRC